MQTENFLRGYTIVSPLQVGREGKIEGIKEKGEKGGEGERVGEGED